jgi:16S rRNA processing protein RimM
MSPKWFTVGKIVNTHGIRGEIKVLSQTDFPEDRFKPGSRLSLIDPSGAEKMVVEVASSRANKNVYVLKLKGWDDINESEKYKNWFLKVSEEQLIDLPEDEYYYYEIIGCTVVTVEDQLLGEITEILSPGANDVWVVQPPQGKPVYIPYIEDVVKQVDVANKKVVVELMEGLL